MKKAKKIGLSLNKKVVSNFQKIKISGGSGTCHCPDTTMGPVSCNGGCGPTASNMNCTLDCAG